MVNFLYQYLFWVLLLGAGAGAGTGQAIEELGETLAGVQKQTLGEVAEDVGKEVAIGFIGDLYFWISCWSF